MDQKKTFALFFDSCIGIITTICSRNGINICNYCRNSIIYSIFSDICSYFCVNHSDNRHLSQNVDALDTCKRHQKRHLPELLQQLILKLHVISYTLLKYPTACILSIKMAWYMQVKRKGTIFPIGGIK